jgi:hypothetical protein
MFSLLEDHQPWAQDAATYTKPPWADSLLMVVSTLSLLLENFATHGDPWSKYRLLRASNVINMECSLFTYADTMVYQTDLSALTKKHLNRGLPTNNEVTGVPSGTAWKQFFLVAKNYKLQVRERYIGLKVLEKYVAQYQGERIEECAPKMKESLPSALGFAKFQQIELVDNGLQFLDAVEFKLKEMAKSELAQRKLDKQRAAGEGTQNGAEGGARIQPRRAASRDPKAVLPIEADHQAVSAVEMSDYERPDDLNLVEIDSLLSNAPASGSVAKGTMNEIHAIVSQIHTQVSTASNDTGTAQKIADLTQQLAEKDAEIAAKEEQLKTLGAVRLQNQKLKEELSLHNTLATHLGTAFESEEWGGQDHEVQVKLRKVLLPPLRNMIKHAQAQCEWKKEETRRFVAPFNITEQTDKIINHIFDE